MSQQSDALKTALEELDKRYNKTVGVASSNLCTHCGWCVDQCHYYLATKDPTISPVAKAERIRRVYKRHHDWMSRIFPRNEPVPFEVSPLHDVAAMGRVWYVEATACRRMHANDRLAESVRKVCRAGKPDGYWRERYHPRPDGSVAPAGATKYCEYAAVLTRVVLGNPAVFCHSAQGDQSGPDP